MNRRTWIVAGLIGVSAVALGCSSGPKGPQTVKMEVTDRGFVPAEIKVQAGTPVTLLVTRKTDATCAKEIVIKDAGIHQPLPLNEEVRVTFTPEKEGSLRYACGMDMIAGEVRVD